MSRRPALSWGSLAVADDSINNDAEVDNDQLLSREAICAALTASLAKRRQFSRRRGHGVIVVGDGSLFRFRVDGRRIKWQ